MKHELRRAFSLAVLGLEPRGTISPALVSVAERMTAYLRAEAREYKAIRMGADQKELLDEKLVVNCESEAPACMALIASNLGVDQLLYGHVDASGPGYRVTLTLLDIETKVELRWTGTVQDSDANLHDAARTAIATLVERFR